MPTWKQKLSVHDPASPTAKRMTEAMKVEAPQAVERPEANSPSIFASAAPDEKESSDEDEFDEQDAVCAPTAALAFKTVSLPLETALAPPPEAAVEPPLASAEKKEKRETEKEEEGDKEGEKEEKEDEKEEEDDTVVIVKGKAIKMRKADCNRASREGRPSEPSTQAMAECREIVRLHELDLKSNGHTRLTACDYTRSRGSASGKGVAIKAPAPENQAKINHLANLKSRNVETYNTEACYLLCDKTAEQHYDRLAESALRANAGNQAVTKRKHTQGASNQTPCAMAPPFLC